MTQCYDCGQPITRLEKARLCNLGDAELFHPGSRETNSVGLLHPHPIFSTPVLSNSSYLNRARESIQHRFRHR